MFTPEYAFRCFFTCEDVNMYPSVYIKEGTMHRIYTRMCLRSEWRCIVSSYSLCCIQEEGVMVFILLYKEVEAALMIKSIYSKQILMQHPNIKVQFTDLLLIFTHETLSRFSCLHIFYFIFESFVLMCDSFIFCLFLHVYVLLISNPSLAHYIAMLITK